MSVYRVTKAILTPMHLFNVGEIVSAPEDLDTARRVAAKLGTAPSDAVHALDGPLTAEDWVKLGYLEPAPPPEATEAPAG